MIDEPDVSQISVKRKLESEAADESQETKENEVDDPISLEEADKKEEKELINSTTIQLKKKICLTKFNKLNAIRMQCIGDLSERFYLEKDFNYLNFHKFLLNANGQSIDDEDKADLDNITVKEQTNQELRDYISKSFPDRLRQYDLESKIAEKMSIEKPLLKSQITTDLVTTKTPDVDGPSQSPMTQLNLLIENNQTSSKTIAERAKNEAQVLQKITQLRKDGLWSIKRLPKLVEPQRIKTHWDFLLDEMVWMSTDFQQERKWKKNASKKLSIAIHKYFKEKEVKAEQQEKEETKRMRKQAATIARDIMQFWRNVEKIIEYKQKSLIEEKRKQAMDMHLNFIVDQTEKYSSWLIESLATNSTSQSTQNLVSDQQQQQQILPKSDSTEIMNTTPTTSASLDLEDDQDFEFDEKKLNDESDDESTIEKEECLERNRIEIDEQESEKDKETDELRLLQQEGEQSIEDLLKEYNLDENYFQTDNPSIKRHLRSDPSRSDRLKKRLQNKMEVEEEVEEEDEDDEETKSVESSRYVSESEMSEKRQSESEEDETKETPLKYLDTQLVDKEKPSSPNAVSNSPSGLTEVKNQPQDDKVLNTIAATAQSLQPTGYTLETTTVKTKIPIVLLKHTLREYQHVGLDWLVTMNENRLNGILADEMGLGKTIQTIALLAYLAFEKGIWGPHLIVVPTSVMLNWELEFKRWCPGFKILTYYGSPKERKLKRQGWTKVNAFHVCITSYKLVIQDHAAFRRKKWKYFILDEAQNIKNFKSQRWQGLLNFQSQRRLLLTGTPLQNNLMELWSLMHFLMPHVFSSHREFQHWFSNPLKCMIEGNQEYNEDLIRRLHKVLRPFILRRLKIDVEKQMPKKYEHVISCKLSKRQRLLYNEFMSLASTKKKLAEGHYMSVINILMQLRKVCNHPDLFEPRPIISSFVTETLQYQVPSIVFNLRDEVFDEKDKNIFFYQPCLADIEMMNSMFNCHRIRNLQTSKLLIEEIMNDEDKKLLSSTDNENTLSNVEFFNQNTFHGVTIKADSKLKEKINNECLIHTKANISKSTHFHSKRLKHNVQYLIRTNRHHCNFYLPVFGTDLHEFVGKKEILLRPLKTTRFGTFCSQSNATCAQTINYEEDSHKTGTYWTQTQTLSDMLNIVNHKLYNEKKNYEMLDILSRFIVYVPNVVSSNRIGFDSFNNGSVRMSVAHPSPSLYQKQKTLIEDITNKVYNVNTSRACVVKQQIINHISNSMRTQFPEKRLIKYDCGKLQTLADLLRTLIVDQHRVLLFTQMTRMLDILENFLNYHGYKYLRLDGSTSIEQRQVLMERFNNDKKIFVFILSTRSGGIGVNLTGADTVIFYDSDWNPTMDAQAQDRCHRIGQTRDVHIYRLISEKTVEENILKKANQKRLLADMTIEGGCFTTALLKKHHISELFNEDETFADFEPTVRNVNPELKLSAPQSEIQKIEDLKKINPNEIAKEIEEDPSTVKLTPSKTDTENLQELNKETKETEFEDVLALVEDESDVLAARDLKAEVHADIAEFDENANTDGQEDEDGAEKFKNRQNSDMNKLESEFKMIETELKPIERYALKFLESVGENLLVLTEEKAIEIEMVKKDWELNRLKQLKEEEERKAEEEDEDEMMYTYTKTEIWINEDAEQMPLWCPLTPPMNECDVFIDNDEAITSYLYDSEPIAESSLPAIFYAKRGDKRIKLDSISTSNSPTKKHIPSVQTSSSSISSMYKNVKMESILMPKLLFDKPNTTLTKLRRDIKMQKLKGWPNYKLDVIKSTLPIQPDLVAREDMAWLPNDDFIVLHTLQVVIELPLNLQVIAPAHQPNWDLVSELVSSNYSRIQRLPLECKKRFESVILKREELCLTEIHNKKQQQILQQQQQQQQTNQKIKPLTKNTPVNITKTKTLRTNQLCIQDNYRSLLQNIKKRFEKIGQISKQKNPATFSYIPITKPNHALNLIATPQVPPPQPTSSTTISSQLQQMQFQQQQQQYQMFELFMSRFNSKSTKVPNQYNSTGNFSPTVANAMSAVSSACRQQSSSSTVASALQNSQNLPVSTESITFKTPKFLAEQKLVKERQAKQQQQMRMQKQTSSGQTEQTPAPIPHQQDQSTLQQNRQQQQGNSTQSSPNQATVQSQLQQQLQKQKATTALAAQLAATAAAAAATQNVSSVAPQAQVQAQAIPFNKSQSIAAALKQQTLQKQHQQIQQQQQIQQLQQQQKEQANQHKTTFYPQTQSQQQPQPQAQQQQQQTKSNQRKSSIADLSLQSPRQLSPNSNQSNIDGITVTSLAPASPVPVWTTTTNTPTTIAVSETAQVVTTGGRSSQTIQQLTANQHQNQPHSNQPIRLYTKASKTVSPQALTDMRKRNAGNVSQLTSTNLTIGQSSATSPTTIAQQFSLIQNQQQQQQQQLQQTNQSPQSPQTSQNSQSPSMSPQQQNQNQQQQSQQQTQQSMSLLKQISTQQHQQKMNSVQYKQQQNQQSSPQQIPHISTISINSNQPVATKEVQPQSTTSTIQTPSTLQQVQTATKIIPTLPMTTLITKSASSPVPTTSTSNNQMPATMILTATPASGQSSNVQGNGNIISNVANKSTGSIVIRQTQSGLSTGHLTTKPTTIASALGLNQQNQQATTNTAPSVETLISRKPQAQIKQQQQQQISQSGQSSQAQISSVSLTSINTSLNASQANAQNNSQIASSTQQTAITTPTVTTTPTTTASTPFATLIKPITLSSFPNQQKQGIITTTNQPQQFRQFSITSSTAQPQQIQILQQQNAGGANQATGIRKVSSQGSLATLQQKVFNKPSIQIVQSPSQRVTKTSITGAQIQNVSTGSATPLQFQQAFQQQATNKLTNTSNQPSSISNVSSTTINLQSIGTNVNAPASLSSLMSVARPQQASGASTVPTTTSKTLLVGNSASTAQSNTSIQQAVPIFHHQTANSSLSQVLKQFSAVNPSSNASGSSTITTVPITKPAMTVAASLAAANNESLSTTGSPAANTDASKTQNN